LLTTRYAFDVQSGFGHRLRSPILPFVHSYQFSLSLTGPLAGCHPGLDPGSIFYNTPDRRSRSVRLGPSHLSSHSRPLKSHGMWSQGKGTPTCIRPPCIRMSPRQPIGRGSACRQRHCGSISSEHGIGVKKRDGLAQSRTAEEVALMCIVKRELNPNGILAPGKVR
jgi:hypothetical protein